MVQLLKRARVIVKIGVAHCRCFEFSNLFVPFEELFGFKYVVKQFFWVVEALISCYKVKILIYAKYLVETTLVKIRRPSIYQTCRVVQTARLQVNEHVRNQGEEDKRTNQMSPDIHSIIV